MFSYAEVFLMKQRVRKGFTLIELIVVLVIMAILAAAAIPTIMGYIEDARKATFLDTSASIYNGVTAYYADEYGRYGDAVFTSEYYAGTNGNGFATKLCFFSSLPSDVQQKITGSYKLPKGYTLNNIYLHFDGNNTEWHNNESATSAGIPNITKYQMVYTAESGNKQCWVICIPGKGAKVVFIDYTDRNSGMTEYLNYVNENKGTEWSIIEFI